MRRIGFGYSAALALAASLLSGVGSIPLINTEVPRLAILPQMPAISKPSKKLRKTTKHPCNGKREVARRLRQIAAGQLTRSNGLLTAEELYGLKRAA